MAFLAAKQQIVRFVRSPLFWGLFAVICLVPTSQEGHVTGFWHFFGFPFTALSVKVGSMGDGGGTIAEGFIFLPDGSPRPASGDPTGWFIHPEWVGIILNATICFLIACVVAPVVGTLMHKNKSASD